MLFFKAFKTELAPTPEQYVLFTQHAGCARFIYNLFLGVLIEDYKTEKNLKPNYIELNKLLNSVYKTSYPWMSDCSKWVRANALINLEQAFKRFFAKKGKFPRFKCKGVRDSFKLNDTVHVHKGTVDLPKIGTVKLKQKGYLPEGNPKSATVSLKAGRWFISVGYEVEIEAVKPVEGSLGVDLGIKNFATVSDGTVIPTTNKLKQKEKRLKRTQKKLSRQKKGSKSRNKTKKKLQTIHYRIANARKDLIHKTTAFLVKTKPERTVVIEDLNVKGMLKNHCLAKAVSNLGAYEFRRQLSYKCIWYGKELVVANRWFPSSKMDWKTGEINKDLKLSDRTIFHSDGTQTDRDLNAAYNLRDYPLKHRDKYSECSKIP